MMNRRAVFQTLLGGAVAVAVPQVKPILRLTGEYTQHPKFLTIQAADLLGKGFLPGELVSVYSASNQLIGEYMVPKVARLSKEAND
jgi:hypothetical protein